MVGQFYQGHLYFCKFHNSKLSKLSPDLPEVKTQSTASNELCFIESFAGMLLASKNSNGATRTFESGTPKTNILNKHTQILGSCCGSVSRGVASKARYPQFESRHWQNLFNINCINCKDENKEKWAGLGPFIFKQI